MFGAVAAENILKNFSIAALAVGVPAIPVALGSEFNLAGYGLVGIIIAILLFLINFFMTQNKEMTEKREEIYMKQAESLEKLAVALTGILQELKFMEIRQDESEKRHEIEQRKSRD